MQKIVLSAIVLATSLVAALFSDAAGSGKKIGQEVAVPVHLKDGDKFTISTN
jgi:hypothetical protein